MRPGRTIAELKELRALTSDESGAQRVAFTGTWAKARNWLKAKLAATRFEGRGGRQGLRLYPLLDGANAEAVGDASLQGAPNHFVLACAVLGRAREPQKLVASCAKARSLLEDWLRTKSDYLNADGWLSLLSETFPDDRTRNLLVDLSRREDDSWARRQAVDSLARHFPDEGTGEKKMGAARAAP
jgi:hypothetical protein